MTRTANALEDARALLRDKKTRIAVVGASNDPRKYGNIILNDLAARGYDVLPVNLHETAIAGRRVYRTLADVPAPVDLVDVVTPPDVTLTILRDAEAAGIGLVWLQPGSFDAEVLAAAAAAPFRTVHDACVMVEARRVAT
ncbi:MAG TPA: CoA-binding protein [Candidatus Polarisedimenticolaceae bacterium]|nr:CoA-binding protein [Candidatus Polarisedimenticolaceae bacterium]